MFENLESGSPGGGGQVGGDGKRGGKKGGRGRGRGKKKGRKEGGRKGCMAHRGVVLHPIHAVEPSVYPCCDDTANRDGTKTRVRSNVIILGQKSDPQQYIYMYVYMYINAH